MHQVTFQMLEQSGVFVCYRFLSFPEDHDPVLIELIIKIVLYKILEYLVEEFALPDIIIAYGVLYHYCSPNQDYRIERIPISSLYGYS